MDIVGTPNNNEEMPVSASPPPHSGMSSGSPFEDNDDQMMLGELEGSSLLVATGGPPAQCVACNSTERVSIHYNAMSCHGCKAFFRRTVFERRKYFCSAEGRCEITDENRNQCRACRFQKCVKGGMNPKHVREERAKRRPLGDSEHEDRFEPSKIVLVDEHPVTRRLVDIENATDAGRERTMERDVLRRQVMNDFHIPDINLERMNYSTDRIMRDEDLTDSYYRAFLILSEWAGDLAEFRLLPQADQMLLFRQNFMIFGWLHFVYRCVKGKLERVGIPLGNGSYLPYKEEERRLMAPKWQQTYAHVGVKLVEMVVKPMQELDVDMEEYVLLKAMALFQTDNQLSPEGQRITHQMRDILLSALITHVERRFPLMTSAQKSQRSVKLTLLFPALMSVGHLEATYVQKLAQEAVASSQAGSNRSTPSVSSSSLPSSQGPMIFTSPDLPNGPVVVPNGFHLATVSSSAAPTATATAYVLPSNNTHIILVGTPPSSTSPIDTETKQLMSNCTLFYDTAPQ